MTNDFYTNSILPFASIIIKICRAYTNTQEDFEDYYQEVCLQIWKSHKNFRRQSEWSTWIYRLSLNVCLTLLKKKKSHRQKFASDVFPAEVVEDINDFDDKDVRVFIRQSGSFQRSTGRSFCFTSKKSPIRTSRK